MESAANKAIAVSRVIDDAMRGDRGRLLAGLVSRLGDLQLAEDALQEASISALKHWGRAGTPNDPIAWLMKVGLNKGIDRIRVNQRESKKLADWTYVSLDENDGVETIPDERLRLIFACCHPALEEKSRVALTLRTVCNLTTLEIAAAFLDTDRAMGQRLSRAKAKIKNKGIGFSIPEPDHWHDRLETVLSTLYLIFTTGYVTEDVGPRALCQEGIFLVRLLREFCPDEPEIEGLLALMLLTDARQGARIDTSGATVPIEQQSRKLWQREHFDEAQAILEKAIARNMAGPYQIKAAIADCHMMRPEPDWQQMSHLYQSLWLFESTPVVALNWAVVIAETGLDELALQKIEALQSSLEGYQPWYAARGHILGKLGRTRDAREAYEKAIDDAPNTAARKLLERKLAELSH